jgi:hypothetical protein
MNILISFFAFIGICTVILITICIGLWILDEMIKGLWMKLTTYQVFLKKMDEEKLIDLSWLINQIISDKRLVKKKMEGEK